MIWYLIICGLDAYKSDCTFSPPLKSIEQCRFVERNVNEMDGYAHRITRCVGVVK